MSISHGGLSFASNFHELFVKVLQPKWEINEEIWTLKF